MPVKKKLLRRGPEFDTAPFELDLDEPVEGVHPIDKNDPWHDMIASRRRKLRLARQILYLAQH